MLSHQIGHLGSGLVLLQHRNNLFFRKTCSLHSSVLRQADSNSFWRKFSVAGHSRSATGSPSNAIWMAFHVKASASPSSRASAASVTLFLAPRRRPCVKRASTLRLPALWHYLALFRRDSDVPPFARGA